MKNKVLTNKDNIMQTSIPVGCLCLLLQFPRIGFKSFLLFQDCGTSKRGLDLELDHYLHSSSFDVSANPHSSGVSTVEATQGRILMGQSQGEAEATKTRGF